MTKTQLIALAAQRSGVSKKTAMQVCDAMFDSLCEELIAGETVQISGLGVFTVKEKAAYMARNPKTNTPVQMPATKRISFSASKVLKEKVNE